MWGLSPVVASGGHSSSRCAGLSPSWPLLLRSTGSRRSGSVVVAHGPSRSTACGILPDQGSNPCPLHWQADSQPLRHQGSPKFFFLAKWLLTIAIPTTFLRIHRENFNVLMNIYQFFLTLAEVFLVDHFWHSFLLLQDIPNLFDSLYCKIVPTQYWCYFCITYILPQ